MPAAVPAKRDCAWAVISSHTRAAAANEWETRSVWFRFVYFRFGLVWFGLFVCFGFFIYLSIYLFVCLFFFAALQDVPSWTARTASADAHTVPAGEFRRSGAAPGFLTGLPAGPPRCVTLHPYNPPPSPPVATE